MKSRQWIKILVAATLSGLATAGYLGEEYLPFSSDIHPAAQYLEQQV